MKVCIFVLSYLVIATMVGVSLTIVMRRCRPTRPLDEEDRLMVSVLSIFWPVVLAGFAGWTMVKCLSMVISLELRAVYAVARKMKGGEG